MKRAKTKDLEIDWKGTKRIRAAMRSQNLVKITINVDSASLTALKTESEKTGVPYQRLLNALLRQGLKNRRGTDSRLKRLERELALIKRRLAA